jgi:hypothetical protein
MVNTRRQKLIASETIADFLKNRLRYFPKNKEDVITMNRIGTAPPYFRVVESNGHVYAFETRKFGEYVRKNPENPYDRRKLNITELRRLAKQLKVGLDQLMPQPAAPESLQSIQNDFAHALMLATNETASSTAHWEMALSLVEVTFVHLVNSSPHLAREVTAITICNLRQIIMRQNSIGERDARLLALITLLESQFQDFNEYIIRIHPIPITRLW